MTKELATKLVRSRWNRLGIGTPEEFPHTFAADVENTVSDPDWFNLTNGFKVVQHPADAGTGGEVSTSVISPLEKSFCLAGPFTLYERITNCLQGRNALIDIVRENVTREDAREFAKAGVRLGHT